MRGSMAQEQMSQLFGRERSVAPSTSGTCFGRGSWNLGQHVQNLHKFKPRGTEPSPGTRPLQRDVIISVGYRVKSVQGTHFRQWATATNIPINSNMVGP